MQSLVGARAWLAATLEPSASCSLVEEHTRPDFEVLEMLLAFLRNGYSTFIMLT